MITAFEVGAIFRIINQASPTLTAILRQVRQLNEAVEKTRLNLAALTKDLALPSGGLDVAIGETKALSDAWRGVAKSAAEARKAIGSASVASSRAAAGGAVAGGGRQRLGNFLSGGGSIHVGGPGVHMPGGGHIRLGGPTMAFAGTLGWGVDQAAKTEKYVWQYEDVTGLDHNETNHARIRQILQNFQIGRRRSIDEAGEAALAEGRLMNGTPGGGIGSLSEFLATSDTEAKRKNTGLTEAMTANVELAHQFGAYTPDAISNLMRTFAAYSVADPRSLKQMAGASGYAVPSLSAYGVDPASILLAGTALAGAGIQSTRSGTWIREAVTRSLPGTALMTVTAMRKQREAQRAFNLIDDAGQPTWYTNGKPDELKMFQIAGDAMRNMAPEDRARYGQAAWGRQGMGAVAVLSNPAVMERLHAIDAIRSSQQYLDRYNNYGQDSLQGQTIEQARQAAQEFNVLTGEIARGTLPAVNSALREFIGVMEKLRAVIPHADGKASSGFNWSEVLKEAGIGTLAGGAAGAVFGPGAIPGAVVGGLAGGVHSIADQWMLHPTPLDKLGNAVLNRDQAEAHALSNVWDHIDAFGRRVESAAAKGVFPGGTSQAPQPITTHVTLEVDGHALAQTVAGALADGNIFPTGGPASNDSSRWGAGDDHFSDH